MPTPATATAVAPAGRPCRRKRPTPRFQRYSYQSLRPPVRVAFPELHAAPVGVAIQRHTGAAFFHTERVAHHRSEEQTSELQSLMRQSYAVFCWKKKKKRTNVQQHSIHS